MTDLDDALTPFFGSDLDDRAVGAVAGYLDAGGILVFNTGAPFDWFYARLLRPLIAELAADDGCAGRLAQVLLILDNGNQISAFDQGGYRLLWRGTSRDKGDGFDELIRLSDVSGLLPHLDPGQMTYLGDSFGAGGADHAMAGKVGLVVNVGPHAPGIPGAFVNLGGGFLRTLDVLTEAAGALRKAGARAPGRRRSPQDSGPPGHWEREEQGGRIFRRTSPTSRPAETSPAARQA